MSHIKDRLSSYHDWMQDIVNRYKLVTARDFLEMIEQLQEDLEQDEKENGWIPVSEILPEESDYYMTCIYNEISNKYYCRSEWFSINNNYYGELVWIDLKSYEKVVAWRPLPEPYKEG